MLWLRRRFCAARGLECYNNRLSKRGDRLELPVDGSDYGLLVEGDTGKLSFQGTRYLGFQRGSAAKDDE